MIPIFIDDGGDESVRLTPEQHDVLNELINIGFGRAASSLSMLVSQRVMLNVPYLRICPIDQIGVSLQDLAKSELVNVHQVFRGQLAGNAMLLMDVRSASALADLMSGGTGQSGPINANNQEALAEVGNIVINAFLGTFGNLLKIHLAFTIPSVRIEMLVSMIQSLLTHDQKNRFAMVMKIRFQLAQHDITGYLVVVMNTTSMGTLLQAMKKEGMLY